MEVLLMFSQSFTKSEYSLNHGAIFLFWSSHHLGPFKKLWYLILTFFLFRALTDCLSSVRARQEPNFTTIISMSITPNHFPLNRDKVHCSYVQREWAGVNLCTSLTIIVQKFANSLTKNGSKLFGAHYWHYLFQNCSNQQEVFSGIPTTLRRGSKLWTLTLCTSFSPASCRSETTAIWQWKTLNSSKPNKDINLFH